MSVSTSSWRARTAMLAATVLALAAVSASFGPGDASAKGGTAKPPSGNPAPLTPPLWPAVPAPVFSGNQTLLHGFDVTGFIQSATVDPTLCPNVPAPRAGGTIVLNGVTITVPCDSIVQMPANTLSWVDSIDIATHNPIALDGTGSGAAAAVPPNTPYPSFEAHVVGNLVTDGSGNTKYIAGLVFLSQQSVNSGSGIVTAINGADGSFTVGPATAGGAGRTVRVQLNDPNGRFSQGQSPDSRFSVDDANATVHSGTGFPMCIARSANDALCPEKNRPSSTLNTSCRNWTTAGVTLPAAGELPATPIGQRCRNYVFVDPSTILAGNTTTPDSRQQAPIEVGDYVNYSGTLFKGAAGAQDYISAHTVEVNVGLYTQPGTIPSYVAIGEFGVGSADPSLVSVNGAAQETQDRIFIETEVTDPKSPIDIYMVDRNPQTGAEINRFITPFEMTGESNLPFISVNGVLSATTVVGGGITTANAGAQVQRDRLRATKAPVGVLGSPTRYVRAVSRNTCMPNKYLLNGLQATLTPPAGGVSTAANTVLPNIQVPAIDVPAVASGLRQANANCLDSVTFANGLRSGSYTAPTFEFIFPENVSAGDPIVPNDFWHLGFLVNGEGPGTGPLTPQPW